MSLRSDDMQAPAFNDPFTELDIGSTSGHIRRYGYRTLFTGLGYDLRLLLMISCVEHFMTDFSPFEYLCEQLRFFNRYGSHEHRLPFLRTLLNLIGYGLRYLLPLKGLNAQVV